MRNCLLEQRPEIVRDGSQTSERTTRRRMYARCGYLAIYPLGRREERELEPMSSAMMHVRASIQGRLETITLSLYVETKFHIRVKATLGYKLGLFPSYSLYTYVYALPYGTRNTKTERGWDILAQLGEVAKSPVVHMSIAVFAQPEVSPSPRSLPFTHL